jgi:threonine/homoserine/homoserine lactone efflux protein
VGLAVVLLVGVSVLGDSSRLGLLTGISIAAPVGPVGMLCIRRTLINGPTAGFVAGLGAATCHALYATLAGLGLAAMTGALLESRGILNLVGGLVLAVLAVRLLLAQPRTTTAGPGGLGLVRAYTSTLAVALVNPLTLLAFAAIATSGLATSGAHSAWPGLPLGIFAGSTVWWFALSCAVGQFGTRIRAKQLVWTNRASGLLLAAFAAVLVLGMR